MSERWKPEHGDSFWAISWDMESVSNIINVGDIEEKFSSRCNCFKTREEAEAAAEKVKALLLSLHEPTKDCNQLPKLTAEVFNRPDCPEWAKWAAVNRNNTASWFSNKPIYDGNKSCLWLCKETPYYVAVETIPGVWDASDWQNSLIKRPSKLPDWCKVGEWVWDVEDSRYVKVISITDLVLLRTKSKCTYYEELKDMAGNYKQAHLRPYNVDELKALVGKPITMPDGSVCLCTAYSKQFKSVIFDNIHWDAQKLVNGGYTIDDEPCGVLEHLNENGEWVE